MNWLEVKKRADIPLMLNQMGLVGEAVEVGVWQGIYSAVFAERWHGKKLWLVDCWEQQEEEIYKDCLNLPAKNQYWNVAITINRVQAFWDRIGILKLFSERAVKLFEDESLDCVYIDANHHTGIRRDLEIWYPKVKPGGIIAGHDYQNKPDIHFPINVKPVVDEFFNDKEHVFTIPDDDPPSWLVIKNK